MPNITFLPSNTTISASEGAAVLDIASEAGITVEAPCGGKGTCKKCLVKIESGQVDFKNREVLPKELLDKGYVMICQSFLKNSDVAIRILSDFSHEEGSFLDSNEDFLSLDKSLLPVKENLNPLVKSINIKVFAPAAGDGLSDLDRLEKSLKDALECNAAAVPLSVIKTLPSVLREKDGNIFVYYFDDNKSVKVIGVYSEEKESYGIAVDIGTTTVAIWLINIKTGEIIDSATEYNGQIECGLDVISRINYARKKERLKELREKVLSSINGLLLDILAKNGIEKDSVFAISLAANTTMVHLFLEIEPEYIRLDPYTPAVYSLPLFTAAETGININPEALVKIAPSVGSYVGGDITSGALCTAIATNKEEVSLFIDIGTNGEILLGNNEFLMGCACSAGPAFEGGGIKCGMRASKGAIERVVIDGETKKPSYVTISSAPPKGICGSGIISLIAELFRKGVIDPIGKFHGDFENIVREGNNPHYIIEKAENSGTGEDITISETDINNFIRAKAAIFSACRIMLNNVGLEFSDLNKVYISGGFGRYLNLEDAKTIGLMPNFSKEAFVFLGNSSVMGAYMTLISKKHREKEADIAGRITYIDLSTEPLYMDEYMAAMFLPHTDGTLFV